MMTRCTTVMLLLGAFIPQFNLVSAEELSITSVNQAKFSQSGNQAGERSPVVLKAQVLLDRARFSPGVIDGYFGANVSQAIEAYEKHHGLEVDGRLDESIWKK
ncbi:MAG: peptidoglycan-binding protein, partial [Pseudomonadota bacterium]|nr:peptidoglycan-binding protein [Pseudomonadota bacterium]